MKTLYHYTSKAGYEAIRSKNTIMKSDPLTTMDAAYGQGYYMTDLETSKCNIAVALLCWNTVEAMPKVEYYLKFEVEDDAYEKCRENVYLIRDWDQEKVKFIDGNKSPECPDYPCTTCEKGKKIIENHKI